MLVTSATDALLGIAAHCPSEEHQAKLDALLAPCADVAVVQALLEGVLMAHVTSAVAADRGRQQEAERMLRLALRAGDEVDVLLAYLLRRGLVQLQELLPLDRWVMGRWGAGLSSPLLAGGSIAGARYCTWAGAQ